MSQVAAVGKFSQGTPECRHGEDNGIQFLKIPELRKVKTDGRRVVQTAGFHLLDEPGQSLIHGHFGVRSGVEQHLDGQSAISGPARGPPR